ncbi:hypothetical protein [Streptomyces rochei]|uniref:hypothetical protein n=1 Tax=Streptomyces rochei TaxID=1928 RepID=UPI0035315A34
MPSRFEFERAIRRSSLPPLARLLALTVATWADVDSGRIATRNQPAQSVLLEATGLSKSAFLSHRKTLLEEGWLQCKSPERIKAQKEHAQNVYSIHIPDGKAGSADDLAKTDRRAGKRRDPRSADDLDLGRQATQPNGAEPAKSGSTLGRQATTRVSSSSLSSLPPVEDRQASSSEERIADAFAYIQPLVRAMTDAGITVSWQMQAEEYQQTAQVLQRAGADAMVDFALATKADSRKTIRYATFFLRGGWKGLPPKSSKPRPQPRGAGAKPPYCGDPDCDEITRMRQHEDDNGLRALYPCPDCHPKSRKDTAA